MSCCLSKSSETQEAHPHRVQLLKDITFAGWLTEFVCLTTLRGAQLTSMCI
jgi:hypothetical protein